MIFPTVNITEHFAWKNKSFAAGSFSFSTDGTAACHTGTETRHQSKMGMV
jgi:hypothetical protein